MIEAKTKENLIGVSAFFFSIGIVWTLYLMAINGYLFNLVPFVFIVLSFGLLMYCALNGSSNAKMQ